MINNRIIHLINSPEDIRALDIENLQKVIADYPYVQSFRALYLVALNKFGSKQYQSELALTAAYTTDKKILYQLLNPIYENSDINENKEAEYSEIDEYNSFEDINPENISHGEEGIVEVDSKEPELFQIPKIKVNILNDNPTEEKQELAKVKDENVSLNIKKNIVVSSDEPTDWNPINVHISTSDELISKVEIADQKEIIEIPEEHEKVKDNTENEILLDKIEFPIKTTPKDIEKTQTNSNISSFINTWKSWLHKEKPKSSVNSHIDKKEAIINKFIENNPKISAVKENTDYVIKDKGENISHLMTETLAFLYLKQKSYAKAIEAFEILKEKHPDRSKDFKKKIKYIKDLQSGKIQPKD